VVCDRPSTGLSCGFPAVAEPWSRVREALIPVHVLTFGFGGAVWGGGLAALLMVVTRRP
jgi:hypothetical protein